MTKARAHRRGSSMIQYTLSRASGERTERFAAPRCSVHHLGDISFQFTAQSSGSSILIILESFITPLNYAGL